MKWRVFRLETSEKMFRYVFLPLLILTDRLFLLAFWLDLPEKKVFSNIVASKNGTFRTLICGAPGLLSVLNVCSIFV